MNKQEFRMVLGEWRLVTICPTKKVKGSRTLLTHKVKGKSKLAKRNLVARQHRLELEVFKSCLCGLSETTEDSNEEQIEETLVDGGDKETEQLGVEENHSGE